MDRSSSDEVQAEVEALTGILRAVEGRGLDVKEGLQHLATALRGVVTLAAGVYKRLERIEELLVRLQER